MAHACLKGCERYRKAHATIMLVSRVLAGELDEATWRYTMHWRLLLQTASGEEAVADSRLVRMMGRVASGGNAAVWGVVAAVDKDEAEEVQVARALRSSARHRPLVLLSWHWEPALFPYLKYRYPHSTRRKS